MRPGPVAWLTGLPASGKSTLGRRLVARLRRRGVAALLLDSDEVRLALGRPAGRGEAERDAFYLALARLAALLSRQGFPVVVAATAPRRLHRTRDRACARGARFLEVHVATPAEDCAARDPKGLWAAARAGRVRGLPGAGAEYEPPRRPDLVASGGLDRQALAALLAWMSQGGRGAAASSIADLSEPARRNPPAAAENGAGWAADSWLRSSSRKRRACPC